MQYIQGENWSADDIAHNSKTESNRLTHTLRVFHTAIYRTAVVMHQAEIGSGLCQHVVVKNSSVSFIFQPHSTTACCVTTVPQTWTRVSLMVPN